jgi:hypothetical protein
MAYSGFHPPHEERRQQIALLAPLLIFGSVFRLSAISLLTSTLCPGFLLAQVGDYLICLSTGSVVATVICGNHLERSTTKRNQIGLEVLPRRAHQCACSWVEPS